MTKTERKPKKLKSGMGIWKTLYTAHFLHTMGEPITSKRLAELRGKSRTTIGYHLKVLRDLGVIEPTELSEKRAEKGKFGSKPIKLNPEKAAQILGKTSRFDSTLHRDEKWGNGLEKEISNLLKELRNLLLENGFTVTKNQIEGPFFIKTLTYFLKKEKIREDLNEFLKETGFVTVGKEKDEVSQVDESLQPGRKGEITPSQEKFGGGSRRKQKKLVRKFLEDPERAEAEAEKSMNPKYIGVPATRRTKDFWFLYNNKVHRIYPDRAKWLPKKGETFQTHPNWKHFNKGRIQADENGASYGEWFDCMFEYFKEYGPKGLPMPNQLHGPRAQAKWNEWEGSGSQFTVEGWNDPLFPPSEYTGKSSQVEYYGRVMASVEAVAKNMNPNHPDMWENDMAWELADAVRFEKIAPAYLEKYHAELFAKVKKVLEEIGAVG